jgi:hypothetical protein
LRSWSLSRQGLRRELEAHWHVTLFGCWHEPSMQIESVSHVLEEPPGMQGCPSAVTIGHVAPVPVAASAPLGAGPVSGHLPTRQSATSLQGCPGEAQVTSVQSDVSDEQMSTGWQSSFAWHGAPADAGTMHVSDPPPSLAWAQRSGGEHPSACAQGAPAPTGAVHWDASVSQ